MEPNELQDFERRFQDALTGLKEVDAKIEAIRFNPDNPASVQAAIEQVELIIDDRLGEHMADPKIAPIVNGARRKYRNYIFEDKFKSR